ncbi:YbhB/YbcL family Raf kinase inhibitor-like protein [Nonomuraea sp. NPDC050663]|uniref:YbhB/YbcL family Raf kinase inhibitor-like protein n=1 Tax=Nonomuraea sp. NPDC050663 TaxID=3364370 RepID=UPI003790A9DF
MGLRHSSTRSVVVKMAAATLVFAAAGCGFLRGGASAAEEIALINVKSSEFRQGGALPLEYTCQGSLGSPPLNWSSKPLPKAKTFAVVVDDYSSTSQAVHWIIYNIDARTTVLAPGIPAEGAKPNDVPPGSKQARLANGKRGYNPPCPESDGKGNFRFSVYALSDQLELSESTPLAEILQGIADLTIARGRLTAVDIE